MALTKISTGMISEAVGSVDLNIDANTMFIDVSTNRVGINNNYPAVPLDSLIVDILTYLCTYLLIYLLTYFFTY